jgi:hypothetical protein
MTHLVVNCDIPTFYSFLYIIIIIIILLIIRVIKIKFKIYELQRATSSGAEQTRHYQWRLYVKQCKHATDSDAFALAHPDHDPLPLDQHLLSPKTPLPVARLQRRHCQWRVYLKTPLSVARLLKDATVIAVFT